MIYDVYVLIYLIYEENCDVFSMWLFWFIYKLQLPAEFIY